MISQTAHLHSSAESEITAVDDGFVQHVVDYVGWIPPSIPLTAALVMVMWRYRPQAVPRRPPGPSKRVTDHNLRDGDPTPKITSSLAPDRRSADATFTATRATGSAVVAQTRSDQIRSDQIRSSRIRNIRWRPPRPVGPDAAARWCDSIARGLRSGASLSTAIAESDRPRAIEDELGSALFDGLSTFDGTGLAERLARAEATESISIDLRLVLALLANVARLGGPAAEPIDRAAGLLRARAAASAERATQSAQAKMSAKVMTALPVVMLAVLMTTSASVRVAIATPVGVGVVGLGVGLNLIGWWWMDRIIAGDSS